MEEEKSAFGRTANGLKPSPGQTAYPWPCERADPWAGYVPQPEIPWSCPPWTTTMNYSGTIMNLWRCPLACEPLGEWDLDSSIWTRWKLAWPSLQCQSNNLHCWGCKMKLFRFMTLFLASESRVFWIWCAACSVL